MWLFPLGIGTIEDVFQALGKLPDRMEAFMSFVIPGAMLTAVCFNMVADMPSGPLDLVVSRDSSISRTSSSSHSNCSGHSSGSGCSNSL